MFIHLRSKVVVSVILTAAIIMVCPLTEAAAAQAARGSLIGFVYAKDMKTPVADAVVKLRSINDQKEYASFPADRNGMYKVLDVPKGRYVVGVSSGKSDYNFGYILSLKGDELAKLSVALVPGVPEPPAGGERTAKSFFTSPAGIVAMVTVAGAVLYAIFKKDENEASSVK